MLIKFMKINFKLYKKYEYIASSINKKMNIFNMKYNKKN